MKTVQNCFQLSIGLSDSVNYLRWCNGSQQLFDGKTNKSASKTWLLTKIWVLIMSESEYLATSSLTNLFLIRLLQVVPPFLINKQICNQQLRKSTNEKFVVVIDNKEELHFW